jgi:hypothetical protein
MNAGRPVTPPRKQKKKDGKMGWDCLGQAVAEQHHYGKGTVSPILGSFVPPFSFLFHSIFF